MTDERSVVLDLVRHSGLQAIAEECHRLAVARGKYPHDWTLQMGVQQIISELLEWLSASVYDWATLPNEGPSVAERGEAGDAWLAERRCAK